MGAVGVYGGPKTSAEVRAFFQNEFTFGDETYTQAPVFMTNAGSAWFLVIRTNSPAYTDRYVTDIDGFVNVAVVVLTSRHQGEFIFKTMDELAGPNALAPSRKFLDKLSPLKSDGTNGYKWAEKWRQSSVEAIRSKKTLKALEVGDTIRVPNSLSFNGKTEDTFKITTYYRRGKTLRGYYAVNLGFLCRLSADNLKGAVKI